LASKGNFLEEKKQRLRNYRKKSSPFPLEKKSRVEYEKVHNKKNFPQFFSLNVLEKENSWQHPSGKNILPS